MNIFVYGSLKRGKSRNDILMDCNATYIRDFETVPMYTMYNLGDFPGVIREGFDTIKGEIWDIDIEGIELLDAVEGHPSFFRRSAIALESGALGWIYLVHKEYTHGREVIKNGTW